MIVLGINDTHDASACLVQDGKVIDLVSEERLNRYKGISSLPIKAIKFILKKNKTQKYRSCECCKYKFKSYEFMECELSI